nr:PREDICTED: atherin-like [Latimeria chalumnae]|eukprot:XP_014353973.1 PREDICTED: atherin-like [Latimeria chalumnae]
MGSRALKCRVLRHRELFPPPPPSPTPWSSGSRGVAESDKSNPAPGVSRSSAGLETAHRSASASKASRIPSLKRSALALDASASEAGPVSVPRPRDEPEAPATAGFRTAVTVLDSESEPEAHPKTEPPCAPPRTSRGSPRQVDQKLSEPRRRHRHSFHRHHHHSQHRSDPLLGRLLEAFTVHLESFGALPRAPPETALPALSSLEPPSLVPASPPQASTSESLALTSDPALLAPMPGPDVPGPASRPSTSGAAAGSSGPVLAALPHAGPKRVSFPHAPSVEGDSGEDWYEAEGVQSGPRPSWPPLCSLHWFLHVLRLGFLMCYLKLSLMSCLVCSVFCAAPFSFGAGILPLSTCSILFITLCEKVLSEFPIYSTSQFLDYIP